MKIKLLLAFIALSLASCSSDDKSDSEPTNGVPGEKKLYKITQTDFNDNGSVKLTSSTLFDEDDRATTILQYDGDGELNAQREFTYNGSGQVEAMVYYSKDTGMDIPNSSYTVAYDGDGRVTTLNDTFFNNGTQATSVTNYQYSGTTIIATCEFSFGGSVSTTYSLNAAGLVYKKAYPSNTEEITYTGENIMTYTSDNVSSIFLYDNEHLPKGQHHNVVANQFHGNMVNALVLGGLTSIELGRTKYAIQRTDNTGNTYYFKYEFDDKGYPTKVRCFLNDESMPYSIREIQYR